MSGIVGVYYPDDRPVNGADLRRMVDMLTHRGPHGSGIWHEENVGLGHRLLHTTPESLLEQQPLIDRRGTAVLTADARIDNREELIGLLNLEGRSSHDVTDAALILAAYEQWGEACPAKLLGDFAFAIWDSKKNHLYCARDHYGIRPFFYYKSDNAFVFASEIKALLCLPETPRRLNERRIGGYLIPLYEDKESTFYADLLRLPPGHWMTVSPEKTVLRAYWALDPSAELILGSDEEYEEAFQALLRDAVQCRLRSAFPVGSMLSGGLDSSSIACTARNLRSQGDSRKLPTISFTFDEVPISDERPFMDAVLEQEGFMPHFVRGDLIDPFANLKNTLWHLDEPHVAYNLFLNEKALSTAQQKGIRIILDGFLGDSTVSHGHAYLADLARSGRWIAWGREVGPLCRTQGTRFQWKALWFYGLRFGFSPLASRLMPDALRPWPTNASSSDTIVNPDFSHRIGLRDCIQEKHRQAREVKSAQAIHYQDLNSPAYPLALEALDKMAAAFATDARLPFTDKRLMEFCLAIPASQKFSNGWPRSILRRGLAGTLPEKVRWRRDKGNVGPIFRRNLLTYGRPLLEDVIIHDPGPIEPYVCIPTLRSLYQQFKSEQGDQQAVSLWLAVMLASWLRTLENTEAGHSPLPRSPLIAR